MGTSTHASVGTGSAFTPDVVERLRAGLRGRLLTPESASYDEARTVWNGMLDRRPGLIVRCAGAADVIEAVRFAREHGLTLAVRGGGHNIAGNAVCDDGVVIDLTPMRSVRVDPRRRTARVEPGRRSVTSTARRKRSGSPRRWGSTPPPGWRDSRWAAASVG